MNIRIGILLLLSFLITSCGLTNKTVLYFKDGKKLTGFGRITSENNVKFKTKESKTQKYSFSDLKRVKMYEDDEINTYVYLEVKGTGTFKVVEEVIVGRVSLYKKVYEGYSAGVPMGGGFGTGAPMMTGGYSYSISNYYVKKENETEITHLGSTSLFSKNFKKAASNYFKDCPSLVKKIQNREFTKKHIVDIVVYFNNYCK